MIDDEADEEMRRRYGRGSDEGDEKRVRALAGDHAACRGEHLRVSWRAVALWIVPQHRCVRQANESGVGEDGVPQAIWISVMILLLQ